MTDATNRLPLWRHMEAARHDRPLSDDPASAEMNGPLYAAEIRAVRDWLVPEEKAPTLMRGPDLERLCARQHLRALLTTEADRAEQNDNT